MGEGRAGFTYYGGTSKLALFIRAYRPIIGVNGNPAKSTDKTNNRCNLPIVFRSI